jgi:hypothetical protein
LTALFTVKITNGVDWININEDRWFECIALDSKEPVGMHEELQSAVVVDN